MERACDAEREDKKTGDIYFIVRGIGFKIEIYSVRKSLLYALVVGSIRFPFLLPVRLQGMSSGILTGCTGANPRAEMKERVYLFFANCIARSCVLKF